MLLREIKDSYFEIDNSEIFFSYGRKLIDEELPEDQNILLLLDPLFTTILKSNLRKIISAKKKKVFILLIPFDNMELEFARDYIDSMEDIIQEVADSNIEITFLTPLKAEFIYLDKTYFKFQNPVFIKIINQFEKDYIDRITEYRSHR